MQLAHWLLNFLNPSTPDKIREVCLGTLFPAHVGIMVLSVLLYDSCTEILLHLVRLFPSDCIDTLLPVLEHTHRTVRQSGYKGLDGTFPFGSIDKMEGCWVVVCGHSCLWSILSQETSLSFCCAVTPRVS